MLSPADSTELLAQFPPVAFAFAYGSGAVEQGGYDYNQKSGKSLPLLDLILVVDDAESWHRDNMSRNPHHYTSLIPLSPRLTAAFQERIKAHFWFNAYVPVGIASSPDRLMKYGVISRQHAMNDLTKWSNLYLAGRLHKPVHIIKSNVEIEAVMGLNREQAIRTSLLLLPEKFQEVDLYMSVASLSYIGDPRMFVGENPNKVSLSICVCIELPYLSSM
jgi:translocator assembly and maintenance protein 41